MRPLLAATVTDETMKTITWPKLASPKIDGVRALTYRGGLMSRSMKQIPNRKLQTQLSHYMAMYLDGELVAGEPTGIGVFNRTSSRVMTHEGIATDITFHVFDSFKDPMMPYELRLEQAIKQVKDMNELGYKHIVVLEQEILRSVEDMEGYEAKQLSLGYEGIMLRDPRAGYKFNRSTLREQILVKVKRFTDAEAVVVGFEELMSNQNEATISETGHTVRSSHKENMVPMGTLGALIVDWRGQALKIGTGFTAIQRAQLWDDQKTLKGRIARFKYQAYGMKDVPRLPVFIGFRHKIDM